MAIVTCHTEGCSSSSRAIELPLTYGPGHGREQDRRHRHVRRCGQQITDIQDV